jgi:2-keto-3-deoxy-L-rhamnonate aldolase RhmA
MTLTNSLRERLRSRQLLFGGWVSFGHPSIAEIFAAQGFDFLAIDMEHSTISLAEAQRIIAASQSFNVPCLPRPVSHSNDWIKPLLDSGADGLIAPMTNSHLDAEQLGNLLKFPPVGNRSFGVNRAQGYGLNFSSYVSNWNKRSVFIPQVESVEAVSKIDDILKVDAVDGVMIGPYDLSGSLGVPGNLHHEKVVGAEAEVISACRSAGKSCGTQIAEFTSQAVDSALEKGYTFIIASSDLFVLNAWSIQARSIIDSVQK